MPANKVRPANDFAAALRTARLARGLSQEDLSELSSRTYVSTLERGGKSPTLMKVEQLASMMGIHPLSLLVLAYSKSPSAADVREALSLAEAELRDIRGETKAAKAN
jgi:transcriptional regulator with XRE-family HTH domain